MVLDLEGQERQRETTHFLREEILQFGCCINERQVLGLELQLEQIQCCLVIKVDTML